MHRHTGRALALAVLLAPCGAASPSRAGDVHMTLEQVLAYAEEHAPVLAIERERARRGDAERRAASTFFPANPSLALGTSARIGSAGAAGDVEIGIAQELEIAGEPGLRRDLADRLGDAFDAELVSARFDVHRVVHVSFHAALIAADAQQGADDALSYAEQLLDIAEKQVQAGEESPLVEKLARAEVSRAREQQLAAQQGARAARLELALVAGLPAAGEIVPQGVLPTPRDTASLASLVALAQQSQPALRLRRAAHRAAQAQVALVEREVFPRPIVGVSYASESLVPYSSVTEHIVLATVEIPLPLWRQNDGERARAQVQLAIAEAEERAVAATLENRIAQAKARVDADARRIELHVTQILPAVDENVRLIQQSFALGEADITAVMLARERSITARRESRDAHRDYFAALAELEAEVGAEIDVDVDQPSARSTP